MGGRALWLGLARGPSSQLEQAGGRALWIGKTWEVAAWEIVHFRTLHLGNYPWEIATWEKYITKKSLSTEVQ